MTDHRPECPKSADRYAMATCICERIEQAEQRLLATIRRDSWFEDGWNQALDAAREAVDQLIEDDPDECHVCQGKQEALDAIDALRETT